jgi:chromosome segregation ATPase
MFDKRSRLLAGTAVTALIVFSVALPDARAAGRIICWKDASGKIVGCGDRVPPEYYESATKELDSRGITRRTTETVEEAERRRARERELARKKAEEDRRLAEQQRQDRALLATYSSEREIDERRNRELEQVEAQIKQLDVALKNANERHADLEARREIAEKDENLAERVPALRKELESTTAEQRRLQQRITSREKDMEAIRSRFDEQKQRFRTLTGGASTSAVPARPY